MINYKHIVARLSYALADRDKIDEASKRLTIIVASNEHFCPKIRQSALEGYPEPLNRINPRCHVPNLRS